MGGDLGTFVMVIIMLSFLLGQVNAMAPAGRRSPNLLPNTGRSSGTTAANDAPPPALEWSKHWYPVAEVRDAVELQSPR